MLTKLKPKMLDNFTQSDTYLIGAGGDYASVNDALQDLSRKYMTYIQGGLEIELQMVAGHVLDEQILASAIDLSGFTLTGQDAETVIDRASISIDFEGQKTVFGAKNAAKMMNIGQLFSMNRTGADEDKAGIYGYGAGTTINVLSGAGIKDTYGSGLYMNNGASANAPFTIFQGSTSSNALITYASNANLYDAVCDNSGGDGITAAFGSSVNARNVSSQNAGDRGIYCLQGSRITADNANCEGAVNYGIYCQRGGTVAASGANAQRTNGVEDSRDLTVNFSGVIYATGASGGTNVTPNTVTDSGIIIK